VLDSIVPDNANQPYDMREVIEGIIDAGSFLEVHQNFAENIVVGFARPRRPQHRHRGQPAAVLAGVLDINASTKAARFVRFCDSFNIPLLVLEDVPGFLPAPTRSGAASSPRRQAALRFLRGHCAAHHGITRKAYAALTT
jgi:propionyl-CoA carboxylase beta chain